MSRLGAPPLLLSRRFAPLFWCQFFAAFNDNFLKTTLVFLILFQVAGDNSEALITLASAVFIAPFFFLSGLGGELADRFDKARMAQVLKFAEMFIAGLSVHGYERHSVVIMFVALAGFGIVSALFGPVKYGILPDHLRREELPAGNALVEGATFIAILTGTITAGTRLAQRRRRRPVRRAGDGLRARLLAFGPGYSAEREGRAAAEGHAQYRGLDRRHAPPLVG